jgi:membrane fusion protein, multidrug efflux system
MLPRIESTMTATLHYLRDERTHLSQLAGPPRSIPASVALANGQRTYRRPRERRAETVPLAPVLGHPLALLLLAAVMLLGVGCSRRSGNEAKARGAGRPGGSATVPVVVAQAVQKTMPVEIVAIGNVEEYSKVAVRSRISGELTRVHFTDGQDVRQGELLFTIDPRPSEAALRQAEANLARDQAQADHARIVFERQKKLLGEELVSRDEFDTAEANLKAQQATVLADRAAISNAALNLEYTQIRSSMDGRTGSLLVHAGNVIQPGTDVLVTVNQIRPIYVTFSVPEQHLTRIKQRKLESGLAVEARIPSVEGPPQQGWLTFVDNAVDMTTGTIQLKGTFDNEARLLWPGQFIEVRLRLNDLSNAVVVPTQAVQNSQRGEFVFVVKGDQTVEMRPVKPGLSRDGETVLEQGLKAGETVVTDGQLRLVPGARVRVSAGAGATTAAAGSAGGS